LPTERIHVLTLELHPTCSENEHETILVTNVEIGEFALDLHSIVSEYCLETRLASSENVCVLSQLTASQ